jgi:hypothetical protein
VAERPLPRVAVEILESVHQHRLLSTVQVHTLHTPQTSPRWTQRLLSHLTAHGLVRSVRSHGQRRLWYVTEQGADALELLPTRAETRRKVITPAQAAGPLRAHTLQVNDAGIAWVRAARERGDECGPFSWRHEIAHPIGPPPGRRRAELLIADALLSYLQNHPGGEVSVHLRFLELDRATLPVAALASKLARYARLHAYTLDGQRQPAWRSQYPTFPSVHVLLAGADRPALERRLEQAIALAAAEPALQRTTGPAFSFALLEDLICEGPFAPVFIALTDPSRWTDWQGKTAGATAATSGGER